MKTRQELWRELHAVRRLLALLDRHGVPRERAVGAILTAMEQQLCWALGLSAARYPLSAVVALGLEHEPDAGYPPALLAETRAFLHERLGQEGVRLVEGQQS